VEEEKQERLSSSFAMIRLDDHAVVISLRQIEQEGLQEFGEEILAHEIGHHVYAPGDLRDNARLVARIRRALPTREGYASLVGNLYTDLLVNDRLQRGAGLDMAGVFQKLKRPGGGSDKLWTLYLRIYETLWRLPRTTLVDADDDPAVRTDADLGARVIRAYARTGWAGRGASPRCSSRTSATCRSRRAAAGCGSTPRAAAPARRSPTGSARSTRTRRPARCTPARTRR
jgi:hypothetical protein